MGIGSIYKQLYFDNENSGDYGLYITGAGVFNAPERDTELITIPGRNGAFALDHGRFENIEITYPAGCFGNTEGDFADTIAAIRAWLGSKRGYVRLEDDYNPDEYRMAVYKSGLEVSPALLKAGEFEITFEAMPQRFLKSGEIAEAIAASGDDINNPTKFNSRPMLEVDGYGTIAIEGNEIEITSQPLGQVLCRPYSSYNLNGLGNGRTCPPIQSNYHFLNTGDEVKLTGGSFKLSLAYSGGYRPKNAYNFTESGGLVDGVSISGNDILINFGRAYRAFTFNLGTAATASASFDVLAEQIGGGTQASFSVSCSLSIDTAGVLTFWIQATNGNPVGLIDNFVLEVDKIVGNSTKSALGFPLYIDLDIGEAWKIEGGQMVSVNNAVSLPAELPELKPGANEITFDNTITDLKIVPRYWTV